MGGGGGVGRDYKRQGRKDTLVLNSKKPSAATWRSSSTCIISLFTTKIETETSASGPKLVVEAVEVGAERHAGMWPFKTSAQRQQRAVEEKCTRT